MDQEQQQRPSLSPPARRLAHLVSLARAADLWERSWRGLIPPLVVVGAFLCVSWLGLWLEIPHWLRASGVALFALLLAASCFGLRSLTPISRRDALRRIDKSSAVAHRPASALDDRLATAGRDPGTDALWALHLRRAEAETAKLQVGRPSPRAVDLDRYALRAGVVVALIACAIVAGPQRYARIAAAFDFGDATSSGSGYRLDAWVDPPAYTGRPPVLLDLASASSPDSVHPLRVSAPTGSTVIIRSSGGEPAEIEASGPLLPPAKPKTTGAASTDASQIDGAADPVAGKKISDAKAEPALAGDSEIRLVLHGDSRLVLRHGGAVRGSFDLTAVADTAPTIALREVPKRNARGSLTLAYSTADDYGLSSAEAVFSDPKINGEPVAGPSLVDAPKIQLPLPGATHGMGDGETTADLSDHPWAGAQVTMVLVAHDEGGNEGRSEPVEITLPQKPFVNPVARALVEQRRMLVLDPGTRSEVAAALDALMIEPEAFGTSAGVYLGLRYAADTLAQAAGKTQLVAVADFLWGMALQIENGDLTEAEKALRSAEKELRDAIDRHASDEEIQKLTQNLQAAMDKFLKELAEQQQKQGDQQQAQNAGRPSKSISQRDLQKLIDRLKEQARSGNREEAKKALDELQDVLENLKTAKRQKADPQARAMAESLNQLDQMMRDQQDLRDQTFKEGQQNDAERQPNESGDQGDEEAQQPGQNGRGRQSGAPRGQGSSRRGAQGQGGQGQGGQEPSGKRSQAQGDDGKGALGDGADGQGGPEPNLGRRQQKLRERLAEIEKKLKQVGQDESALGDAGDNMREAENALREGKGSNGQAVDAQGRALQALQKGAKKLAEAMKQGQEGGEANGETEGSQGSQTGEQANDADPLGRPRGGSNTLNSASRFDPLGIPAAQRAQRVLEELRRRLGDPARAQDEIDYLERLLRSY